MTWTIRLPSISCAISLASFKLLCKSSGVFFFSSSGFASCCSDCPTPDSSCAFYCWTIEKYWLLGFETMRVLERQPFSDDIGFPVSYDIEKRNWNFYFRFPFPCFLSRGWTSLDTIQYNTTQHNTIPRGYDTAARRYEFYFRVVNIVFTTRQ